MTGTGHGVSVCVCVPAETTLISVLLLLLWTEHRYRYTHCGFSRPCVCRKITNYTSTVPAVSDDPKLPDSLNEFYCRFDRNHVDEITQSMNINTPSPPFAVEEDEVRLG